MLKRCLLCNCETEGSTGAAGIQWSTICQECKDREDTDFARAVTSIAKSIDIVCMCLKPREEVKDARN